MIDMIALWSVSRVHQTPSNYIWKRLPALLEILFSLTLSFLECYVVLDALSPRRTNNSPG